MSFKNDLQINENGIHSKHHISTILVFGAGVLGSVYAGKLKQAGYQVTLLARGNRLTDLREKGLLLIEDDSKEPECIPVEITEQLAPQDHYDLILVIVRKNQIPSVLPILAANRTSPNILFMVNNAEGPGAMIQALGAERILLGFPGAGGERKEGVVHYRKTSRILQPTTIGELDGKSSSRIHEIAKALSLAGFPVSISRNMDAWLKTHAALVSPIANAIYMAGGSNYRLAHTRDALVLMVRAVKESLHVLRKLNVPITPVKYLPLLWLPEPLLIWPLQALFDTPQAELILARHANTARDEMLAIAEEFRGLARRSGLETPASDTLFEYIDPQKTLVQLGSV